MTKRDDWILIHSPLSIFVRLLGLFVFGLILSVPESYATGRSTGNPSAVILILPFQVNAGQASSKLEADFPVMLGDRLAARGIQVVSNQRMLGLIQSRNIATLNTETVRNLAAAAGATHAIYGSVNQMEGNFSVDARIVTTRGGAPKPYFVDPATGANNLSSAINTLALRVSSQFAPRGSITAVEVRGTKVLDPEVILLRINTRVGDSIDPTVIDADVKTIWDLGYFSDVQVKTEPHDNGMALIYTVIEKPRIESIAVEGSDAVDEDDIIAVMSSKSGNLLNEKILADDIQKIIELYRKKGYYLAQVNQRIDLRQNGSSAGLAITVNEGKKLYIKEVKLEGVQQLSESDIKNTMLLSERSIISWITGSGVLKEELIERDSSAITAYYLDNGFLDIMVGAPNITYDEDGITVSFPINEGTRYKLGEVTLAGDLIDTNERLLSLIELNKLAAKGAYFKLSVMQEDTKKLTDFYAEYGYAYAEVNPDPKKRSDDIIDVVYYIEKKNIYHIGRVTVEGNNKTRDSVILREMRLADGEPFEGSKLRRSNERLNRLGYFEMAEVELVPTENEDEVDLKVKVKEKPTGALMGGVGYSTFSSVGVAGTLTERNLFGKGYQVSLQAGFSGRRDAYTFAFTNPRFNDTDLSVGFDLYHWRDDYIDYRKKTTGVVARFSYPLGEYTSLGFGYRFDQYKIYDLDDDVSHLIRRYDTGDRYSSVALGRITRDTTDRENPTSGNVDRITFDYGGGFLGGDDDFITVTLEHQSYYQLWKNHVLHGRVKGSAIFKNDSDDIPIFERFWMGGINSIRGYNSRDIVPRDPKSGDRIGGTRMAFANLEYIWTFSEEMGLALVPFFDVGFNIDDDHHWTWDDELLKSVGAELRWRSPLGDLRFSYGVPLDDDRKGNRDSGRFEFSMGQTF